MTPTTSGLGTEAVLGFVLFDLALILAAARLLGALARRLRQPVVVGEIVAGVLLGPTLLGPAVFAWDAPWAFLDCGRALSVLPEALRDPSITACLFPPQARSVLGVVGQLALVLFMFLVGLELDHRALRGRARPIAAVGTGVVAVPIALGFVVAPALYNADFVAGFGTADQPSPAAFSLMLGALLSVSAFPVMARILQEKHLTRTTTGSVGIAAAAVVTVLMFLTVGAAAGVARGASPGELVVRIVGSIAFVAAMLALLPRALAPLGRAYEARGSLSPTAFAGIVLTVLASAFAAHQIGINVIIGGFLAGVAMPAREGLHRELAGRLSDVTVVVLLPVFLAFSGLQTDFTRLRPALLGGVALVLVAAVAGKWGAGLAFGRLGGLSWKEANLLGVLLNCRGLLVLVVALTAVNEGVVTAPLQVAAVLMALVTTIMTGPLVDRSTRARPPAVGAPGGRSATARDGQRAAPPAEAPAAGS